MNGRCPSDEWQDSASEWTGAWTAGDEWQEWQDTRVSEETVWQTLDWSTTTWGEDAYGSSWMAAFPTTEGTRTSAAVKKGVYMRINPTYVVLDIGCTRSIGSRMAQGSRAR